MKKILILGSVSFRLDSTKVGINWIAEYLAANGYQVTYVSSASTILDLLFEKRRKRFVAAWLKGGVFNLKPNLVEVVFKSPWLLNRLSNKFQHRTVAVLERKLLADNYDILIATVGALSLFVENVNAPLKILRLQDHPHDFGLSNYVVSHIEKLLRQNVFNQIWPVSSQLYSYAVDLAHGCVSQPMMEVLKKPAFRIENEKVVLLPNGINLANFIAEFNNIEQKKAIYVGVFSEWIDVNLVCNAARLLPAWQFDLFGPGFKNQQLLPTNVKYCGQLDNRQLPQVLARYAVGLIPFVDCPHIKVVERPLKFAQYLAAGLGIASVDYGGLRQGMGEWACYGNSTAKFAEAIEDAYQSRQQRTKQMVIDYLQEYDWDKILHKMQDLLEKSLVEDASNA